MKLATTTGDFAAYGFNAKESIAAIREAGFKYIDYSFGLDCRTRTGFYSDDWKAYGNELKDFAQKLGVSFVQAHSPMGRPLVMDGEYEQFILDTKRSIEAAAYLGIPNIVVHSGYQTGLSKEETFYKNKIFYEDLLKVAEKSGITILTENFNKMCVPGCYWVDSAEDQKSLIDYINHPLLKGCWDVGHGNLQELPQHEALKILGKDVLALHIQDNMGNDDHHIMPFMGITNIDSVMHGLIDIGYNGYFTFESDNVPYGVFRRRKFKCDTRCLQLPVEFRKRFEAILYDIGKFILTQYNCFEE